MLSHMILLRVELAVADAQGGLELRAQPPQRDAREVLPGGGYVYIYIYI